MIGSMARVGCGAAAAALIGLSFAAPAQAADDGYANVFSSLFSAVGLVKADPPPDIAYRERPPLVLPPQPGLPKPVDGAASRNAAWPKDPDVMRHRKELEEARAPRVGTGDHVDLLTPGQTAQGRGESEPAQPSDCYGDGNSRNCLLVNPDALRAMGEQFRAANPDKGDVLVAGKEPDRVYLTQPPKGYMKATKTVKATTEAPAPIVDASNPRSFLTPAKKDDE